MFEGSFVAIVTPFKNGKVDAKALKGLIEFHIKNGTNGIVPVSYKHLTLPTTPYV